jgi:hypothetical protein
MDLVDHGLDAAPGHAAAQAQDVARVAIEVEEFGEEVCDPQ